MNAKRPLEDGDGDDIKRQKLDITEADNEKETLFFTPEDSAAFVNAVQTSDLTKVTNLLLKLKQVLNFSYFIKLNEFLALDNKGTSTKFPRN